eukprot:TRINITY_DN31221_c0_g2_i3.p1 TRINITY_DN31221_c0_g2~~TRINITY_DN31221_c0_g2_i3.p1  ORF type:complete len:596 (+),score=145.24 TRINITY_DN31221_c0_g2_i3:68-1789(+)
MAARGPCSSPTAPLVPKNPQRGQSEAGIAVGMREMSKKLLNYAAWYEQVEAQLEAARQENKDLRAKLLAIEEKQPKMDEAYSDCIDDVKNLDEEVEEVEEEGEEEEEKVHDEEVQEDVAENVQSASRQASVASLASGVNSNRGIVADEIPASNREKNGSGGGDLLRSWAERVCSLGEPVKDELLYWESYEALPQEAAREQLKRQLYEDFQGMGSRILEEGGTQDMADAVCEPEALAVLSSAINAMLDFVDVASAGACTEGRLYHVRVDINQEGSVNLYDGTLTSMRIVVPVLGKEPVFAGSGSLDWALFQDLTAGPVRKESSSKGKRDSDVVRLLEKWTSWAREQTAGNTKRKGSAASPEGALVVLGDSARRQGQRLVRRSPVTRKRPGTDEKERLGFTITADYVSEATMTAMINESMPPEGPLEQSEEESKETCDEEGEEESCRQQDEEVSLRDESTQEVPCPVKEVEKAKVEEKVECKKEEQAENEDLHIPLEEMMEEASGAIASAESQVVDSGDSDRTSGNVSGKESRKKEERESEGEVSVRSPGGGTVRRPRKQSIVRGRGRGVERGCD